MSGFRFWQDSQWGAGTQAAAVPLMQTRDDLYHAIDYYGYEKKLDDLFGKDSGEEAEEKPTKSKL